MEPEFLERCRMIAGLDDEVTLAPDNLIGVFQKFRPDGKGLDELFQSLPRASAYQERLARLFAAAGDDRRPGGGRDAYFVVRQPPPISPEDAQSHATSWLKGLARLARRADAHELSARLDPIPRIRVLEGAPPKQPKSDLDTFSLLRAIKVNAAAITDGLAVECQVASLMREAYYFTACDAMLRDYLLWPAYAEHFGEEDPLLGYFELWRHGVKVRVFHDDMIDLYLPR